MGGFDDDDVHWMECEPAPDSLCIFPYGFIFIMWHILTHSIEKVSVTDPLLKWWILDEEEIQNLLLFMVGTYELCN